MYFLRYDSECDENTAFPGKKRRTVVFQQCASLRRSLFSGRTENHAAKRPLASRYFTAPFWRPLAPIALAGSSRPGRRAASHTWCPRQSLKRMFFNSLKETTGPEFASDRLDPALDGFAVLITGYAHLIRGRRTRDAKPVYAYET
jgi:hypothetical protein